jgi:hypothetical protein
LSLALLLAVLRASSYIFPHASDVTASASSLQAAGRRHLPRIAAGGYSVLTAAIRPQYSDGASELQPAVDTIEHFLLRAFLQRYVTWCARRSRFAQMQGAARLCRQLTVS